MIKTIKNLIITGFISGIIVGNSYTNSMNIFLNQIGTQNSQFENGFTMTVNGNGTFNTTHGGDKKNILAFGEYNYFFRTNNKQPYISDYYPGTRRGKHRDSNQGTVDNYLLCDNFNTTTITNCTNKNYSQNTGTVESILGNINKYIYGEYIGSNTAGENYTAPIFCFNSDTYGKSICFYQCAHPNCGGGAGEKIGGIYPPKNMNLQENNDRSFNTVPEDAILEIQNTSNNTTNITSCPTIKQLMQSMGPNYKTGLCYNNTNYYNGTNFVQIEKEDIFTIFNDDYENYTNRISIYRNNCNAPATSQNCGNAFSGEFKKFSIISNAINSKVDEKNLWNYCNLGLNYDPNATTCTLNSTGIIKEEYTTEEEIQNIINNGTIPTPNTNNGNDNVINTLNNCEDGDRTCYINNRNFIDSLSSIYGKITGLFKERKNVNGIIPEYILRITFITILFTVIFKK